MVPTPTNAGSMWKWNVKQDEKTSKEGNTTVGAGVKHKLE